MTFRAAYTGIYTGSPADNRSGRYDFFTERILLLPPMLLAYAVE